GRRASADGPASRARALARRRRVDLLHDEHLGELAVLLADQRRRVHEPAAVRPVEEAFDHVGRAAVGAFDRGPDAYEAVVGIDVAAHLAFAVDGEAHDPILDAAHGLR